MRINQRDVAIGQWWAMCCIRDLVRVESLTDQDEARTGMPFAGAWTSLEEALIDLLEPRKYQIVGRAVWREERRDAQDFFPSADWAHVDAALGALDGPE